MYGTATSSDGTTPYDNVFGLGPIPTGVEVTQQQRDANFLYNLFNDESISNQSVNFKLDSIVLGSTVFDNVGTDALVAKSAKAKDSKNELWTWTQDNEEKFSISYKGAPLPVDEDKRAASVIIGNGAYTLLPIVYYKSLATEW